MGLIREGLRFCREKRAEMLGAKVWPDREIADAVEYIAAGVFRVEMVRFRSDYDETMMGRKGRRRVVCSRALFLEKSGELDVAWELSPDTEVVRSSNDRQVVIVAGENLGECVAQRAIKLRKAGVSVIIDKALSMRERGD